MKSIYLSLVLLLLNSALHAQEDTVRLSYNEAVKIALKKNVTLNQQKNNLFSRQVQKSQSIAAFFPDVTAYGTAQHTDGTTPNPNGGELVDLSYENVFAGISVNWTIFNGLNNVNNTVAAHSQFFAQSAFVKRSEQNAVADVTNQYLQVLLDQELLRIAEETYRTQEVVLQQLKEQARLGARAESDLYTQDAQVRNLQVTALRARATLENDKALLAQTLQLDPAIHFEVEAPEADSSIDGMPLNLESLYEVAVANRADLTQANFQRRASLSAHKATFNGYLPRVTLFADYGSQYISTLRGEAAYGNFRRQFTNVFPSLTYGVRVSIPIFDRLQTRVQRATTKVNYENAVLDQENLEKRIKIDVKRTYNNLLTAIEAYEASKVQLQAGELALKTQRESIMLGLVGPVELAQATQTYVQAAASKAQAEITLAFQKVLLDYALGTLKPAEME